MKISRRLLASLAFRPFTKTDYYGFSGIDGNYAELYEFDIDGSVDCVDVCENIRELPSESEVEKKIATLKRELAELENLI